MIKSRFVVVALLVGIIAGAAPAQLPAGFVPIVPAGGRRQPGEVVSEGLGVELDGQMRRLAEKGFSGILFVARGGRVVLKKGYGTADREAAAPYTAETVFDVGSITKQFTGAAVLKLEMQGKLSTADSLSKYLKGVPADKAGITLHHLLTHTAGLVPALGRDYDGLSRDEMVKKAMASKLLAAPGVRHEYSNVGYSLLAAVVELASGQSYERYLRENLFAPAGMTETGYLIPKWKREKLAVGYGKDGGRWGTPLDHPWDKDGPYWNLRGNGGILSTVGDLYNWHLALEGEKVLSKEAKAKYFAPHVREEPGGVSFYGYGWVVQKTPRGTSLIWHNGGNPFFFADFRRYTDENVVLIVATNSGAQLWENSSVPIFRAIFAPGAVSK